MKGDIHKYVLSTNSFLFDIGEPRYWQNNTGYQIIKKVKYRLIPYSYNLKPCTVLPVSRLPNIAQISTCTQIKGDINRYVLSTSSCPCDIGGLRYRQINTGYKILRIGY